MLHTTILFYDHSLYHLQCETTYKTTYTTKYDKKCTTHYKEHCEEHGYGYHKEYKCHKEPVHKCHEVPIKVPHKIPKKHCFQGNLLRVFSTCRVRLDLLSRSVRRTWTIISETFFLLFQFFKYNNDGNIYFDSENIFWIKFYKKTAILNHFVSLYRQSVYWEKNTCKQIEIAYLLMVL